MGLLAISPLLVFIFLYLVTSIIAGDFYKVPITVAFMVSSIYAIVVSGGKPLQQRINIFSKGASDEKIMLMIWIFILAGAFANGIDRWLAVFPDATGYKGVVDFIYVSWFANFNVADIYVTLGCIAMMIYLFFFEEKLKKNKQKKEVNTHE